MSFPRGLFWVYLGYVFSNPRLISKLEMITASPYKHIVLIPILFLLVIDGYLDSSSLNSFSRMVIVPILCAYFYTLQLPSLKIWIYLRNSSILYYLLHFMTLVYMRNLPILCTFTGIAKWFVCLVIISLISAVILYCEKRPWGKRLKYLH